MGTSLGEQIFNRRKSLGWSIREVARRAGVCPSTVRRIETGEVTAPNLETLCRLEEVLEVPLMPASHVSNTVSLWGKQVRKRRRELGLTKTEAAEIAGIRRATLQDIEFGYIRAHGKTISKISKALGMGFDMPLDDTVSPLGREVRRRRLERNMSITELADAVGITDSTISALEHGKAKSLHEEHLYKLKKVLRMDVEPDSEEELSLGAVIRKVRIEAGFSRGELASLAGISVYMLENYEWDKVKKIPGLTFAAIANVFRTLEDDASLSRLNKLWERLHPTEQQNVEELSVGAAIRSVRTKAGLSRVEFASLAGITADRLRNYESDRVKRIPAQTLAAIEDVFLDLEDSGIITVPDTLWERLRSVE